MQTLPAVPDVVIDGEFVDLNNGSRSTRFWVGFGAGKSKCRVRLSGKSVFDGHVIFSAEHERISAEGLSKDELAENVTEVARDIAEALASNLGSCSPSPSVAQPGPSNVQAQGGAGPGAGRVPVDIDSIPANAEVYVDGVLVGTTPLVGYRLQPRLCRIELVKVGFVNWKRRLLVSPDTPTKLTAELAQGDSTEPEQAHEQPGSPPPHVPLPPPTAPALSNSILYVRTDPRDVEVVIDGLSKGFTTRDGLTVPVPAGEVTFQLRKGGYQTQEFKYRAEEGKRKTFRVYMRRSR